MLGPSAVGAPLQCVTVNSTGSTAGDAGDTAQNYTITTFTDCDLSGKTPGQLWTFVGRGGANQWVNDAADQLCLQSMGFLI